MNPSSVSSSGGKYSSHGMHPHASPNPLGDNSTTSINLIFFDILKSLPRDIQSVARLYDLQTHYPSICAADAQDSPTSLKLSPSQLYEQQQQKLHYKASRQSYLFECLKYYEKRLEEAQYERHHKKSRKRAENPTTSNSASATNPTSSSTSASNSKSATNDSHSSTVSATKERISSSDSPSYHQTHFTSSLSLPSEPVLPQWSLDLNLIWNGDKRVLYMLQLGNVYLEYQLFAEANYWLHAAKTLCQEIISTESYDPFIDYLFTETQYSLSCTLFNARHYAESIQYLEAAHQRVINLLTTFMHPHIRLHIEGDLTYNIIQLYIKILIQAALHQSNHDSYQFQTILVNQSKNDNKHHLTLRLLQKAMKFFLLLAEKDDSVKHRLDIKSDDRRYTDPVTNTPTNPSADESATSATGPQSSPPVLYISNYYHRKNTIHLFYLIAKHLNHLDFDILAKDYIDKIVPLTHSTLTASHTLYTNVLNLSQQLQKQLTNAQQQRLRMMHPAKHQSKLSILSQFTEDDTDDEDDWSYEDDDEDDVEEGLSSRLRNRLTAAQQSTSPSILGDRLSRNAGDGSDTEGVSPSAHGKQMSGSVGVGKKSNPQKKAGSGSAGNFANILKESIFPDRFRFFKSRDLNDSHKEKKVYASPLFSLHLPGTGKQKFESLQKHREWLSNIILRHNLDPATHSTNENIIVNNFIDDLSYIDEFSIAWAVKFYETCEILFHLNTPQSFQQCNDILIRFFTMLPDAKMTENIDMDDLKTYVALFNIGIELLRIAALTLFPQSREQFEGMKDNLQQFYPKYRDYVTLINIEALCHNLNPSSMEDEYIVSTLLQLYEKYHTMLVIYPNPKAEERSGSSGTAGQHGSSNSGGSSSSAGSQQHPSSSAGSMSSSQQHGTSSATRKAPIINPLYHIRQGYELACHSLLILHHYLCHLSPITRAPLQQQSNSIDLSQYAENNMMEMHHRIPLLETLYRKVSHLSPLKARVALTLGTYYRVTKRNLKMAERSLFESLYIFDQVSTSCILPKRPPVLSLFALCAMSEYAETLLERDKYCVASVCYDNLVLAHNILYGEHNYKLINRLAVLCAKNNDWGRSAQYILILLEKARKERNIPKVVFLSEKISREYMERGDFRNAEHYISQCVEFIEEENARNSSGVRGVSSSAGKRDGLSLGSVGSNNKRDPLTNTPPKTDLELKLQLKLAHLFLQGYYFERGIDLLAKLMDQKLTPIQKCQVLLELSEAYLKKRWLKESEIVLEKLVKHLEVHCIPLGNLEMFNHVNMLQTASRLYYRKGQYALSLFCVNTALEQCDPSHLPRFANLFRIKGKIFHAISGSNSNTSFPTTMEIGDLNSESARLIISLFQQLTPRMEKGTQFFDRSYFGKREIYRSSSEALNDALKYYEKSSFCYSAINDCINVTRIHLLISRAQIEYLFAPMAFLQCKRTMKFFNNEFPDQEFAIDLQSMENEHVIPAVEVSVQTTSIMLALDSYMTIAELRYLQGRKMSSQEYWTECLHILFTLFMKGTQVVVRKGSPPGFLERILSVVKRLVRLMFCYHKQFVNDNLAVIDSLLMLERELLQVLKRHNDHDAWASTPFDFDGPISGGGGSTSSSMGSNYSTGGNTNPADHEAISHLIRQNKVYQALPCNHSVTKSKSLPFLRRRKKKGSLKNALSRPSLFSRTPGGTGSTGRSRSLSSGAAPTSEFLTEDALTMSERVNERIWGCFFRMKQHQRKFSSQNISQQELSRRNQDSMRRLWNLMKALREKMDDGREGPAVGEVYRSEASSGTAPLSEEDTANIQQIDQKIRRLSVDSADHLVVNCLYKTIGSQKKFKRHSDQSYGYTPLHRERRHPSLPSDISFIKLANRVVDEKMLKKLVYIIRLDDIIVYYTPHTGERRYQKFGGRDLEAENDVMWLDGEIQNYIESVLTQGRRKKMKTGEDDAALKHMKRLFYEAPFSYEPEADDSESPSSDLDDCGRERDTNANDTSGGGRSDTWNSSLSESSISKLAPGKLKGLKFKKKMIPSILQYADSSNSLCLIVSHHLQVIPWESLFTRFCARHFTLQGLIERRRQNGTMTLSDILGSPTSSSPASASSRYSAKSKPCFFMLYSEDEARFIMPLERDRKNWIYSDLVYELGLVPDNEKPSIVHDILPNLPLHAPVIKYGKRPKSKSYRNCYKPINFIQLSRIAQNTNNIFTQIESHLNQNQFPVFIFTFGDLVDLSECIHYLVTHRKDCTLLFIPEKYIIHATKTICIMQKSLSASEQAGTTSVSASQQQGLLLNQSIQWLRKMLHIPVVCVNPP